MPRRCTNHYHCAPIDAIISGVAATSHRSRVGSPPRATTSSSSSPGAAGSALPLRHRAVELACRHTTTALLPSPEQSRALPVLDEISETTTGQCRCLLLLAQVLVCCRRLRSLAAVAHRGFGLDGGSPRSSPSLLSYALSLLLQISRTHMCMWVCVG